MATLYSLAEVQKHKDREDCWVIIHDKVYDVTQFLEEHPGGDEVILSATAKDATDDFEDVGHSDGARQLMSKYVIGDIDVLTLPKKADHSRDSQVKSISTAYTSSELLIKVLQFLIPLTFLALAIAVRYLSKDQGNGAPSST
jgi:cytochrome b involved in lipid metabolism